MTTTSGTYLYKDFERSEGIFDGYFAESGIDTNSDTRFDYLKARIGVNMLVSVNYTMFGYLYDKNGYQILTSNLKSALNIGNNLVDLFFCGISISLHRVDGSYYLKNISLQNEAGSSLDYPIIDKLFVNWICKLFF